MQNCNSYSFLEYWTGGSKTKCNHKRSSDYIILVNAKIFNNRVVIDK